MDSSLTLMAVGVPGKNVTSGRFALVGVLVLFAGKYRDVIQVIPAVLGFFMYQVSAVMALPVKGEGLWLNQSYISFDASC